MVVHYPPLHLNQVLHSHSNFPKGMRQILKVKVKVKSLSPVGLFVTPWTAAYQAPLSMGLPRQEYWSGVPKLEFIKNVLHYL